MDPERSFFNNGCKTYSMDKWNEEERSRWVESTHKGRPHPIPALVHRPIEHIYYVIPPSSLVPWNIVNWGFKIELNVALLLGAHFRQVWCVLSDEIKENGVVTRQVIVTIWSGFTLTGQSSQLVQWHRDQRQCRNYQETQWESHSDARKGFSCKVLLCKHQMRLSTCNTIGFHVFMRIDSFSGRFEFSFDKPAF